MGDVAQPSVLDRVLYKIHRGIWDVASYFRLASDAYCDIETVHNAQCLATRDGALVSLIRVEGVKTGLAGDDLVEFTNTLATKLRPIMAQEGHYPQIVFGRDNSPVAVRRVLDEMAAGAVATMERLDMNLDDFDEAHKEAMARYCANEYCYIALWTDRRTLPPMERRRALAARGKEALELPPTPDGQWIAAGIPALQESHEAAVSSLTHDLASVGVRTSVLSATDALREIRLAVDPEWTAPDWTAAFPGDGADVRSRIRMNERGTRPLDASALLWPAMSELLIPRGFDVISTRAVSIGSAIYTPVVVALLPANLEPFGALFDRLRKADIPYRLAFRMSANGVNDTEIRMRQVFSLLSTSKRVRKAIGDASADAAAGNMRVGLQVAAVTWVEDGDTDKLKRYGARLARALQGWGGCEVDDRLGNPAPAVLGTVPALRSTMPGPLAVPPLEDAAVLLPLTRPASPWKHGSMLLRTPDGRLFPYQPYSQMQEYEVTLGYAPMGAGKSVFLNTLNTALALAPGNEGLPRIGIIDIGPSSSGHVSLIRNALPPDRQHEVLYKRLRMVDGDAINPCDTPLGMRTPTSLHRQFLINLIIQLATPVGDSTPVGDVPGITSLVVDEGFKEYSDKGSHVRRYDPGVDAEVDGLVDRLALHCDERTTWWELVDTFYQRGEIHVASLAQRYAVPLLGDLASFAVQTSIQDQFRGKAPNGEPITEYFWRSITQAIREYPILVKPTRLDLGDARIVSLDLAEVAPKGGANADRQTAIMYMLARHAIAWEWFLVEDHLQDVVMPEQYQGYHQRRIASLTSVPKRMCYDEYHRTEGSLSTRAQTKIDIREGRKARIGTVLFSQLLGDFDADMRALASTIVILGVGQGKKAWQETIETFGLSDAAAAALRTMGKPSAAGSRFLALFDTKQGQYVHELMNTLSALELWAYSTTPEDRDVRDRLYKAIGASSARRVLAKRFPKGTCVDEVDRRRMAMDGAGVPSADFDEGIISDLVGELVMQHENSLN